jgi:amino acid transporter
MEKVTEPLQFTKDKPAIILAVIGALLAFSNLLLTFVRLRSHDFKVPVQYIVNDGSVLQTSNWYTLYSTALFSVLSVAAVIFIAHRLHKGNRQFAIGILAIYLIIAVINILVTNALLGLVGRV